MKFFKKDKDTEELYLVEWKHGYVQGWTEWNQIRYKRFNWITFVLIEFEIERELGDGITIELGLLGFRLRIHSIWKASKLLKQISKEAKQIKKDIEAGKKFPGIKD